MATLVPHPAPECGDAYCHQSTPKPEIRTATRDWMSRLPDDRLLSEITLPGTHDTGARHGGIMVECQSWSIQDQLDAGIRYLDIRCRHTHDAFRIHHGFADQNLTFDEVMKTCTGFLAAHPKEALVMRIKEEYKPEANTRPFAETFAASILPYRGFWRIDAAIPRLKEARGKIVLITEHSRQLGGIPWESVSLQDDYEVPTIADISAKSDKVRAKLDEAKSGPAGTLYVNHCSGTGLGGSAPAVVARQVNGETLKHIRGIKGRYGIVILDFPGERLIRELVGSNFPAGEQPKN